MRSGDFGMLTVVGCDQLMLSVVWLASRNLLLAIQRSEGQLFGPIHPIDAGIYVMFVRGSYLQYPRHPVVGLLGNLASTGGQRVLSFHGRLVRHVNEVLGVVFDAVDCTSSDLVRCAGSFSPLGVGVLAFMQRTGYILTNKAVVACHVQPLLARIYVVDKLHRLA